MSIPIDNAAPLHANIQIRIPTDNAVPVHVNKNRKKYFTS